MAPNTRVSGRTICSTVVGLRLGLTVLVTTATTLSGGSTASALTSGTTGRSTRATGRKTKSVDSESTRGLMEGSTRESGKITIWKD
jgi:hypothetical protein